MCRSAPIKGQIKHCPGTVLMFMWAIIIEHHETGNIMISSNQLYGLHDQTYDSSAYVPSEHPEGLRSNELWGRHA